MNQQLAAFVSAEKKNNCTLDVARAVETKLNEFMIQTSGVYGNPAGSGAGVPSDGSVGGIPVADLQADPYGLTDTDSIMFNVRVVDQKGTEHFLTAARVATEFNSGDPGILFAYATQFGLGEARVMQGSAIAAAFKTIMQLEGEAGKFGVNPAAVVDPNKPIDAKTVKGHGQHEKFE